MTSNSPPLNNIPTSSSFQTPRLISQSYSTSASRPVPPPHTAPAPIQHDIVVYHEQRSHTAPNNSQQIDNLRHDLNKQLDGPIVENEGKRKVPEIRTVIAVPETDILEDENYSDNEDELLGADEYHEKDGSINCKFYGNLFIENFHVKAFVL